MRKPNVLYGRSTLMATEAGGIQLLFREAVEAPKAENDLLELHSMFLKQGLISVAQFQKYYLDPDLDRPMEVSDYTDTFNEHNLWSSVVDEQLDFKPAVVFAIKNYAPAKETAKEIRKVVKGKLAIQFSHDSSGNIRERDVAFVFLDSREDATLFKLFFE